MLCIIPLYKKLSFYFRFILKRIFPFHFATAHNISQVCVVCVNVISFFLFYPPKKENPLKGFSDLFSHEYSCFNSFTGIVQNIFIRLYRIFFSDQHNGGAAESKISFFVSLVGFRSFQQKEHLPPSSARYGNSLFSKENTLCCFPCRSDRHRWPRG